MDIEKLHQKAQEGECDLYTFLERELPDISIEDRLKVMAQILNDFLEDYSYDQSDKIKRAEYSITRFRPKKR